MLEFSLYLITVVFCLMNFWNINGSLNHRHSKHIKFSVSMVVALLFWINTKTKSTLILELEFT